MSPPRSVSSSSSSSSSASALRFQKMRDMVWPLGVVLLFLLLHQDFFWQGNQKHNISMSSHNHHNTPNNNPQGPWFECMSMTGPECAEFIRQATAKSPVQIHFGRVDASGTFEAPRSTNGKNPNHVIIYVNNENRVQETPARGSRR